MLRHYDAADWWDDERLKSVKLWSVLSVYVMMPDASTETGRELDPEHTHEASCRGWAKKKNVERGANFERCCGVTIWKLTGYMSGNTMSARINECGLWVWLSALGLWMHICSIRILPFNLY